MAYTDLLRALYEHGYDRVERDDRLLDVFTRESREKGVELWEKWPRSAGRVSRSARWDDQNIKILRVRFPFDPDKLELFTLARGQLESLLTRNQTAQLDDFERRRLASDQAMSEL